MGGEDELLTIERVAVLRRVPLFGDVPGHILVAVARLLDEMRFDPGETIIEQGAVEDWLFLVASGKAKVHRRKRAIGHVGAGDVVGELAVLSPAPRAASVTALEPMLVLRLQRKPFEELLDDHPEIARAVIETLARLLQASGHEGSEV